LPRSQSALVAAWPGSSRFPYPNRLARAVPAQKSELFVIMLSPPMILSNARVSHDGTADNSVQTESARSLDARFWHGNQMPG
jgi:hypothetical protein